MLRRLGLFLILGLPLWGQGGFDVRALLQLVRVGDPQLSPDGKLVAFTAQTVDLEANRKPQQIYVVPIEGGQPRRLTSDESNSRPRWSPDGKQIAFVRTKGGESQIWMMAADGSSPHALTKLATEADGVLYARDGKHLVFTSRVYPECHDEACNQAKLNEEKQKKSTARSYTSLLYRHWTSYQDSRRQHLFSLDLESNKTVDLTPGVDDVPPFSTGGPDAYAISPDGQEVCYAMNVDRDAATSTNSDLYTVPIGGGEPKRLTTNPGADTSPVYSPDGKYLAYRSQARGGYESDRWRLVTLERATGKINLLTEYLDRDVESVTWLPDSSRLFFTVADRGRVNIRLLPVGGGSERVVVSGNSSFDDVQVTPDGKTIVCTKNSAAEPAEIYRIVSSGQPVALTNLNADALARWHLAEPEEVWVESADKTKIHTFVFRPRNFEAARKYPVLFLIHGGPEGAWGHTWSYRWNAQVFADAGFVVVEPNPRGSTGYGGKFTEEIQADWGGKAYEDVMAVADSIAQQPYADADRFAAAGGSYGGYMVNWMLGHTNRFKALVSHAGVYDLPSSFGETEELWFPLWEFKGTPWDSADTYSKWSPSHYAANFKTPTLVMHGELDYRVPVGQGMQLFTALQVQKVPSKLVLFPDEGHWVLKPANSVVWYETFLTWVKEWTQPSDKSAAGSPTAK